MAVNSVRYIEDLTRVVISYETTTSVRFCLLYDCFKWGFIALKDDIISVENNVVTDGIMTLRASNQVLCNVWS